MSYKTSFLRLLIVFFVLFGLFAVERTAFAAGVFGGRILKIIKCDCPPGALFMPVGPPRAKLLMFIPGVSKLYAYGALKKGRWVLGTTGGAMVCLMDTDDIPCAIPVGAGEIIKMIGTSK
ncbi:MAG: hypothetical protein Q8R36_02710 [bacterium]|nr:hypothetical protein [bacterium]